MVFSNQSDMDHLKDSIRYKFLPYQYPKDPYNSNYNSLLHSKLSGTRLEASGRVHVGWSINGKEYALGGLVNNITSDLVAKAIWVKGYWVGNSIWASGNLCSGKFATTQEYISKVWNGGDYYNWNCKDPLDIDKEEIYTGTEFFHDGMCGSEPVSWFRFDTYGL